MKILALDPATKTGWAHSCGLSGHWDFTVKKDESTGMRLIRFRGKLDEILRNVGVDIVVYEMALHITGPNMKRAGAHTQSEIQGVLKLWCEDNKIQYQGFSPTKIKLHATGNGKAKKPEMVRAAQKKFKKVFESDDEADAVWILDYARHQLLGDAGA